MTLTVTIINFHDQVDDISTTSTAYRIIYVILIKIHSYEIMHCIYLNYDAL